jgi:hypothetical protein
LSGAGLARLITSTHPSATCQALGWRGAFLVVGVLGLLSALVVQISLPPQPAVPPPLPSATDSNANAGEPLRQVGEQRDGDSADGAGGGAGSVSGEAVGGSAAAPAAGLSAVVAELWTLVNEPTVALLLLASTLRFLAGFTIGVWIVPFYREAFPGQIGAEYAAADTPPDGSPPHTPIRTPIRTHAIHTPMRAHRTNRRVSCAPRVTHSRPCRAKQAPTVC